ncbi:NADH dehydrogenase [ubiquinone] 1 beta subcomplex subunit 4 [Pyxicephalus adspersus]|uniref:NADH dehydrogenase [ubiquinone] 1 beta subcomplex subunit 4 n=1 Tax=Pyxicephalus adspersus TaxID=30357 RepID=A0AAV3B4M2_PYXAD|nr:TPA: hypothetical protein GDO54_002163 [Pyxicephalus adspersus]
MVEFKESRYASRPEGLDPARYYELTPEQRRLQEERVAIRAQLKRKYQLQLNDPHRIGMVTDPAVERWAFARNYNIFPNHRGTAKVNLLSFLSLAVPFLLIYTGISLDRKRHLKTYEDKSIDDTFRLRF